MKRKSVYGVRRAPVCTLGIELLESRLSLSVSVLVEGNTLRILGDNAKQNVVISDEGMGTAADTVVSVDADGDGSFTNNAGDVNQRHVGDIRTFDLSLRGGNDSVQFFMNSHYVGVGKTLNADLGGGNDRLSVSDGGGNRLSGGSLDMNVIGGSGSDQVALTLPAMREGSRLSARLNMGAGNDTASVSQPNTSRMQGGSSASFEVDMGVGDDRAQIGFNGDVADNTQVNYHAVLGNGNDAFDGTFDMEDFDLLGAASRMGFDVRGGNGNDTMAMLGTDFGSDMHTYNQGQVGITLDGGTGRDRMDVLLGTFQMDGGTFLVRTSGGSGNDSSNVALKTSTRSVGGTMDVAMRGDQNNDVLTLTLNDQAGNSRYGPNGSALVDGGSGLDTGSAAGNGTAVVRRCER